MPEHESEFEKDLREVGRRLRAGLAKRHPATQQRMNAIRETVREQWELKQQRLKEAATQRPATQKKEDHLSQPKPKDKDQGHSH